MHRAHVDYAAAVLLVHLPKRGTRRQKGSIEMNRQQLLPLGEFEIDKRLDDLNASIADEHIERAECGNRFVDTGIYLVLIGDVHGNAQRAPAGGI